MHTLSPWIVALAIVSINVALICFVVVAVDELAGHRQRMWIMNLVWPITMLWSGPVGLLAYYLIGRRGAQKSQPVHREGENARPDDRPFWQSVGLAATHCGSGCALADLCVEWAVLAVPVTIFGSRVAGTWLADFVVAFVFGIAFQYMTIAPIRHLRPREGIVAALKADTLSLAAWQLGMYGWMAIALFVFFSPSLLPRTGPTFWFMMQIAMFAGFATSYPVNWWLLRTGVKETM